MMDHPIGLAMVLGSLVWLAVAVLWKAAQHEPTPPRHDDEDGPYTSYWLDGQPITRAEYIALAGRPADTRTPEQRAADQARTNQAWGLR